LFKRFEEQGMKVWSESNKEIGSLFVVPGGSTDVQGDGIRLKEFIVENITDPELKRMVEIARKY